ncbi:hypothetical protein TUM19329_31630 [Legionella antarctica]|uniref:Uncharacterized protein n=2 Tax=Legionella antarctica TaxID=2708020 RepID=A0A6F8T9R7_9GAMM|nr:hypothetical protein TUM19329_31630 [Legionella antarctica]
MTIELTNIFSGLPFDSDRHGNQLRVYVENGKVQLGQYDFGEMALEKPSEHEIALFCKALSDLPEAFSKSSSFDAAFESILSKHINLEQHEENKQYLMRIRKAILALHDFQMELTNNELIWIIKNIAQSTEINSKIQKSIVEVLESLLPFQFAIRISNNITNIFTGLMNGLSHTLFGASDIDTEQENNKTQSIELNESRK